MAFKKGLPSPNPSGRPKGNATAQKLRELIADDIGDIISVLKKQALAGDVASAKLLLERVVPALRSTSDPVILNTIEGDTLADTGRLVFNEISRGNIPISEGSMLITSLANQARIVEVTELERRISELESGK